MVREWRRAVGVEHQMQFGMVVRNVVAYLLSREYALICPIASGRSSAGEGSMIFKKSTNI